MLISPDAQAAYEESRDFTRVRSTTRNVIEKARDHRSARLDTADLDALLAADQLDPEDEVLKRRFRELTASDFGEGLALAVAAVEDQRPPS